MSSKITYNDFVDALSRRTGQSKNKSDQFIKSLINLVTDELKDTGRSGITNLGAFKVVDMPEREGVNPHTGEPMTLSPGKRISFSAFKALKEQVNENMGDQEVIVPDETPAEPEEAKGEAEESTDSEDLSSLQDAVEMVDEDQADTPETTAKATSSDDPIRISVSSRSNQEIFESQLSSEKSDQKRKEEKQEKESTTEYVPPSKRREKNSGSGNGKAYMIAAVIFVICFTAYAIYYFTQPGQTLTPQNPGPQAVQVLDDTAAENTDQVTSAEDEINETNTTNSETPNSPETPASTEESQPAMEQPAANIAVADETDVSSDYEVHVVNQGEWLYQIAEDTYGMARFWPLILQANQELISDPDELYPSMEISIPVLDGSYGEPSQTDYQRLSEASQIVADRYEEYGQLETAQEYREFSGYYAMIASGELAAF